MTRFAAGMARTWSYGLVLLREHDTLLSVRSRTASTPR